MRPSVLVELGLRQLSLSFLTQSFTPSGLTPSQSLASPHTPHTALRNSPRFSSKTSGFSLWEKTAPRRFTLSLGPLKPLSLDPESWQ